MPVTRLFYQLHLERRSIMADSMKTILERSSIRAYTKEELTKEEIDLLIKTGLLAPTAANRQEIFIAAVKTSNPVVKELQTLLNPNAENTFYYNAPELFLLFGKEDFKWSGVDAGIAVENMHLAAKAMGLGSVIIGYIDNIMHGEKSGCLKEALKVPEGYGFEVALAAGHPDTDKEPHEIDTEKNSVVID